MPIIVLSAVGEESEKIAALDAGADDYVTKPFSGDELLARVRRAAAPHFAARPAACSRSGSLRVDLEKRLVTMSGEPVSLTPIEYDLLRLFAANEGKLLTHPAILRAIWGPAYGEESNYLHVYISHLRRKIEPDPAAASVSADPTRRRLPARRAGVLRRCSGGRRYRRVMSYSRLLVPISAAPDSDRAVEVACSLAAERGAELTAVFVIEISPLLPLDARMDEDEIVARRALHRAQAIADSFGVHLSSAQDQGT